MTFSITKVFKLDMGHRTWTQDMRKGRGKEFYHPGLPYPVNKCANIHGHSLCVTITLESETLDEQNFVIDTDLIKVPFGKIIDEMDHAFVMDKNDVLFDEMKQLLAKENLRLFVVDFSPSFEALAEFFYKELKKIIHHGNYQDLLSIKEVKVSGEHTTVEASYRE